MSSILPDLANRIPGIQYPNDLQDATPEAARVRNIFDNLFFIRRRMEEIQSLSNTFLTQQQISQLVTQIITSTTINVTSNPVTVTTHAIRLTMIPTLGALVFEYDRMSLYVGSDSTGTVVWTWTAGDMIAAFASRPTDLGTADKGFIFTSNDADNETQYTWTGTEFVTAGGYLQEIADAATVTITTTDVKRHVTSGAATTGFGAGEVTQLEDSGGNNQTALYETVEWSSAATNTSFKRWWIRLAGTLTLYMGLDTNGLSVIANLLWKSGTNFFGILDHGNSADRTYTFPDATGNVPSLPSSATTETGSGAIVRTTSPTIVTPTIASFVNANHNHQNAAGGGTLDAAAIASGTIGVANGGTGAGTAGGARSNLSAAEIQAPAGAPATITLFKITGGGVDGSLTITAEGTISAFVAPT